MASRYRRDVRHLLTLRRDRGGAVFDLFDTGELSKAVPPGTGRANTRALLARPWLLYIVSLLIPRVTISSCPKRPQDLGPNSRRREGSVLDVKRLPPLGIRRRYWNYRACSRHLPRRPEKGGSPPKAGGQQSNRLLRFLRYFIPVSHMTVTTVAPAPSRSASRSAATTLLPVEVPANRPSSLARRNVIVVASPVETVSMSSAMPEYHRGTTKPAPTPSIL